jgi:hypothetical protein
MRVATKNDRKAGRLNADRLFCFYQTKGMSRLGFNCHTNPVNHCGTLPSQNNKISEWNSDREGDRYMKMNKRRALIAKLNVYDFYKDELPAISECAIGRCPFCLTDGKYTFKANMFTGSYVCINCGEKGELFDFLIYKYRIKVQEAVKMLAQAVELQRARRGAAHDD